MGFERAKIEIKPASVGTGLKVTLAKTKASPAKLKFSLSRAVAGRFGWSDGDKLEVLIGNGEHHGILRFRKNNSIGDAVVTARKAMKGDYFSISLGHQPAFVDRSEASRWCQFELLEDGYLEVILPRWADETAPKKQVAAAPVAPTPQPKPGPKQTVTAGIMGDPPPGRREMLDKIANVRA